MLWLSLSGCQQLKVLPLETHVGLVQLLYQRGEQMTSQVLAFLYLSMPSPSSSHISISPFSSLNFFPLASFGNSFLVLTRIPVYPFFFYQAHLPN